MFDQGRGEKCDWCTAQDKNIMPCPKLDEVGRRIVLRTDREICKREICARYPEMISYEIPRGEKLPAAVIGNAIRVMRNQATQKIA